MTKQVREDFLQEVLEASREERDYRFKSWAKWVDSVNPAVTDGYAFQGTFINAGTIEIEVGEERLILVSTASGSHKYQVRYYRIVALKANGTLEWSWIGTDDRTKGWALRIRDEIAASLAELQGQTAPAEPVVTPADVLAYLNVLALVTAAGITVTDQASHSVEVKFKGERRWIGLPDAANYIAEKITEVINND